MLLRALNMALTQYVVISGTTDAIFLEKPACYDLVIDLTTSTPSKATRPTFYSSKLIEGTRNYKLSVVRFTWSDIKLVCIIQRDLHRHLT